MLGLNAFFETTWHDSTTRDCLELTTPSVPERSTTHYCDGLWTLTIALVGKSARELLGIYLWYGRPRIGSIMPPAAPCVDFRQIIGALLGVRGLDSPGWISPHR